MSERVLEKFNFLWNPELPKDVVGLLNGIRADDATTDMGRWNVVADALADNGDYDRERRVKNAVNLWKVAEELKPKTDRRRSWSSRRASMQLNVATLPEVDFEKWRLLSTFVMLVLFHGPCKSIKQALRPGCRHRAKADTAVLRRYAEWNWCRGLGFVDETQKYHVLGMFRSYFSSVEDDTDGIRFKLYGAVYGLDLCTVVAEEPESCGEYAFDAITHAICCSRECVHDLKDECHDIERDVFQERYRYFARCLWSQVKKVAINPQG